MDFKKIIVLDLGLHENQTLARKIRDMGVYSEILSIKSLDKLDDPSIIGIILSGEDRHNTDENKKAIEFINSLNKPFIQVYLDENKVHYISENTAEDVSVSDFEESVLSNFVFERCNAEKTWNMEIYSEYLIDEIKKQVGDKKVVLGLSGGVDSSVTAALIQRAIGDNLYCIFVNHGLMRKYEPEEVMETYKDLNLNVKLVDATDRFLDKLAGEDDPEKKRKIIGEEFIRVFEEESQKLGKVDFLAQGTIYPDIIESGVGANLVKSHHNVGGLPEDVDFKELVEPLSMLFKDEVRQLGLTLGVPEDMVFRQPFPGPGLGVRVMGDITREKLRILRDSDYVLRREVKKAGLDREIWQYFTVFTPVKSVGIKQGKRAYENVIAVRAVQTTDAMEVKPSNLDYDFLVNLAEMIITEVDGVSRVVYDISPKPPATIEWE